MTLKHTYAASRNVAWHVYYSNRRAKLRLLATSIARQIRASIVQPYFGALHLKTIFDKHFLQMFRGAAA